eukprot:4287450-Lingulodinium_polyedra.AAC.1
MSSVGIGLRSRRAFGLLATLQATQCNSGFSRRKGRVADALDEFEDSDVLFLSGTRTKDDVPNTYACQAGK